MRQPFNFWHPYCVTAFSGLFLGERVGFRRWSAVAVAFAGVIVVAQPGSGAIGVWGLLPLVTAMLLAILFDFDTDGPDW